jgi:bacillopeptidase F (M6 metalloprotease family)
VNGGFEDGSGVGWTEHSLLEYSIVLRDVDLPVGVAPHTGRWAAWLGGDDDELAYLQQQAPITAAAPTLSYHHWIDSEDSCGFDFARVRVDGVEVDSYTLCIQAGTAGWVRRTVDLSAYVGQTVQLRLEAATDRSRPSSLYVDDVMMVGADQYVYLPLALTPQ